MCFADVVATRIRFHRFRCIFRYSRKSLVACHCIFFASITVDAGELIDLRQNNTTNE